MWINILLCLKLFFYMNVVKLICWFFLDEKYLAFVTSQKAHANILSIDPSEALKMPGVVDFVSHKDVQGHNNWGIFADEEIFAKEKVSHLKWKLSCTNFHQSHTEREREREHIKT